MARGGTKPQFPLPLLLLLTHLLLLFSLGCHLPHSPWEFLQDSQAELRYSAAKKFPQKGKPRSVQPREARQDSRSWNVESPKSSKWDFPIPAEPKTISSSRAGRYSHFPELWWSRSGFIPNFPTVELLSHCGILGSGTRAGIVPGKFRVIPPLTRTRIFWEAPLAPHSQPTAVGIIFELNFSIWTLGIIAKPLSRTRCFQMPREKPPWNCRAPGFLEIHRMPNPNAFPGK